ncbi:MAG: 4Fe-4S binding protein [Myxococcales bacterium]|nr:4Fe-4S binding protein [Myxococcales bacterium]
MSETAPRAKSHAGLRPGPRYRLARRVCQTVAFLALVAAPVLGGVQRVNRTDMAGWDAGGFDLWPPLRTVLRAGEPARLAHELNVAKGAGSAHEYFGVSGVDPLAGTLALVRGGFDSRAAVAWLLPVLLGLMAGRAFCGWLCPFGTLARWLDAALSLLPFHVRIALPKRRPLRFLVALATVVTGFLGLHFALYLTLPFVLLQQSLYALFLLGGASTALCLLGGLLLAGMLFGPTTYCATLCPTGGVLALLGRGRRLHLALAQPKACGRSCELCSRACWLQLNPSSGDPGPDCDLCGRCVPACPRTNLIVRRRLPVVATLPLSVCLPLLFAQPASAEPGRSSKPRLVLDVERAALDATVAVSIVDARHVRLVAHEDSPGSLELSIFVARGMPGQVDTRNTLPRRQVYRGPLTVDIMRDDSTTRVPFSEPNAPSSTPRQTIYRIRLAKGVEPGDELRIHPVAGWLPKGATFAIPAGGTQPNGARGPLFGLAAAMLFSGLASCALGCRMPAKQRDRSWSQSARGGRPGSTHAG